MNSRKASLRGMVYASMFGAMTAIGAYIAIPLQPVPITLQTLFSSLAGALLGGYLGALSQVVYLLLGVMGLPVFAGGAGGLGCLVGPAGGYLTGFIVGTFVIGKMMEIKERPGFIWIMFSMIVGQIVIYGLGIVQLSVVARLSLLKSVLIGATPFLAGDTIKIIAATFIALKVRDRIKL